METPACSENKIIELKNFNSQITNIAQKIRRLIFTVLLTASAGAGCIATTPKGDKTYDFRKTASIRTVNRQINFCAISKKDIYNESVRCTSNIKFYRENGLECLSCLKTEEVPEYQ